MSFWLLGGAVAQIQGKEYDPKKGFTPAQRSLTTAFLKMAGSLEEHGDPEVYIRWVLKENARIDAKYAKVFGGASTSRPAYLTDEYVTDLIASWRKFERPLKLKKLSQEAGKHIRHAILGEWNKSPEEWAVEETDLNDGEKQQYRQLMKRQFFAKSDFAMLERFYADGAGHDKLSDAGKREISQRYWLTKMPPEKRRQELVKYEGGTVIVDVFNDYQQKRVEALSDPKINVNSDLLESALIERLRLKEVVNDFDTCAWNEKDAVRHSHMVRELFKSRFKLFEGKISKEGERITKENLTLMAENLLVLAHLEFMAGLSEHMADVELAIR